MWCASVVTTRSPCCMALAAIQMSFHAQHADAGRVEEDLQFPLVPAPVPSPLKSASSSPITTGVR